MSFYNKYATLLIKTVVYIMSDTVINQNILNQKCKQCKNTFFVYKNNTKYGYTHTNMSADIL